MSRDYKLYLDNILSSIDAIETYTKNISYEEFVKNKLLCDGVIRNLEIIGEAVKNIPKEIKIKSPQIEWRKIIGIRDILIHEYFGINLKIIWDIIVNKIPGLKDSLKKIYLDLTK